jgi:tetrapyrrole methylase family protein/MazG family protein
MERLPFFGWGVSAYPRWNNLMNRSGIILLGLGPGDPQLLTRQAWGILENIPEIYLRTGQHPVARGFPPSLKLHTFDYLYESGRSFEDVYTSIIEQVLALAQRPQGVVYAVPGHPFIAEATAPEIAKRARVENIPVQVVEGLSFLEPVFSALGVDPLPHTAIIDAFEFVLAHVPFFPPDAPAIIAQIHSRALASDVKLTLMEIYPHDHPIYLIHMAGNPDVIVEQVPLYELDRSEHIGLLTTLYLPPLVKGTSFESFQEVIAHLRAPDGCPWDREQTHQTLRPHLLEETYEVLSALDADDPRALCEELGDLLLQIVLHTQVATDEGTFCMPDVIYGIYNKIVNRHPHVFGDVSLADAESVLRNWEHLKALERENSGHVEASLLDGVAPVLPALSQAQTYQKRAARVGFDWKDIEGVLSKVLEEVEEIRKAENDQARAAELGDLFFVLVNLARWFNIDAESALREANIRFRKRFGYIENAAREQKRSLADLSLDEMEALWQLSKKR